ncbi:MAG: DUF3833 family protein [Proteobacteria bacterium]|nr:DUF3833 family protein [Pseudomonadota bacterium]
MSDTIVPPPATLLFRPDAFFIKPWRGWGVVRDGRGRPVSRYSAHGQGRTASRSAETEQVFVFDNGTTHTVRWELASDGEAHYWARDLATGVEARGVQLGENFEWRFRSPVPTRFGKLNAHARALHTLATPTTAFGFTEIRWMGLLLSSFTTFYEQI